MSMRRILEGFPSGVKRTLYCEKADCERVTREGKPFCTDHVDEHPYVKKVLAAIAYVEHLQAKAAAGMRVSPTDVLANEIVHHLELRGPLTEERIATELMRPIEAIQKYAKTLLRTKRLLLKEGKRYAYLYSPNAPRWESASSEKSASV